MNLAPATNSNGNQTNTDDNFTLGDKLNKLSSNVANGRDVASIHYRSDYRRGLHLDEKVTINILSPNKIIQQTFLF